MASDISELLYPSRLSSFREDFPPVECKIWKGGKEYDDLTLTSLYPFDTIDTLKRMICHHYKGDLSFFPRFLFVGISPDDPPTELLPIDYLWYPPGSKDPQSAYRLPNPVHNLTSPDERFVTSTGEFAAPNMELRGRSTVEQVFLRDGRMPVFHVFRLSTMMREYKGVQPISLPNWNKCFAPYFPDVPASGPHRADKKDEEFASNLHSFLSRRESTLDQLNQYLEDGLDHSKVTVSGVRQIRLTWKRPVAGFDGCASLFYELPVTEKRPYLRFLPAEGTPIIKLHVRGVLPIPTLEDPRVLEGWEEETSPTPGIDFCCMKYVHRHAISGMPPIYGTIHLYNDGTMNLMLQPPKDVRKLYPKVDLRGLDEVSQSVFEGLPQPFDAFQLKEISVIFSVKIEMRADRFTKTRLQKRLPYFQTLFTEITPLPENPTLLSLRYKAVSQYASEDKMFQFITQLAEKVSMQGDAPKEGWLESIQDEFEISQDEAKSVFGNWLKNRSTFTVQLPEEGEFVDSFHPGVDLHMYADHPLYYIHIHRVDSMLTYRRIHTLLSLLFMEDDSYFGQAPSERLSILEEVMEEDSRGKEERVERNSVVSNVGDPFEDSPTAAMESAKPAISAAVNDFDDPFAEEEAAAKEAARPSRPAISRPAISRPAISRPPIASQVMSAAVGERQKLVDPNKWFINKLKKMDPNLFAYTTDESDENAYSRKCAGNIDRQPSILTQDQYDRMREIYEDDPIFWIVYPIKGKEEEPIQPLDKEETIRIMRYGSSGDSLHYYFCPEYYCLSCEIMVRPVDFKSDVDREDNQKPPDSCPFCYGGLIEDRKHVIRGNTVIKRKEIKAAKKSKGSKFHEHIAFMTKTTHPQKLSLPCCFISQETLRIGDKAGHFNHIRDALLEDVMEEEEEELPTQMDTPLTPYRILFENLHREYILDYTNHHLDVRKFAMAPPAFDAFFRQNSSKKILERLGVPLKLRPNAVGFLRIGTEHTPYESLLGVLVPILHCNTIEEVKNLIKRVMVPRIFLNAHFGNLVLEFYQPADGSAMPPTQLELQGWAQKELGITLKSSNLYPLILVYNAYKRFERFIDDPTKRKDLRHLQPLLSEPGLFTVNGIQLIIMENHGDLEPVTIKCPIFGVSPDRHRSNDFVFLSRTMKTIGSSKLTYPLYELYIHTMNRPAMGGTPPVHSTKPEWNYGFYEEWPEIVQKRVEEYMTQCQSRYRSLYTSQRGVDSLAMIPLSKAVESVSYRPDGIIKDQYNHIVGITFKSKAGSSSPLVCLPVVDDGVISISSAFSIKQIYLDWEDIKAAPIEDVIQYYRTKLEPAFALYPGYRIKAAIRHEIEERIVAVQLENGIMIPAAPPREEAAFAALNVPIVQIQQLEWDINKRIDGVPTNPAMNDWDAMLDQTIDRTRCGSDSELVRMSSYGKFEEEYQQFRWMVSNWIASSAEVRSSIETILFHPDLPDYERRKRLSIILSTTLLSWFYSDPEEWERGPTTFLRKDCRIQGEDTCTGSCYWKAEEGKCLLHVDATTQLGEREVSTPELFTKRVMDELARFPARRKQLLEKGGISKATSIIAPIRMGDQYIIPESSPSWSELLRMEWLIQPSEEPQYYEEMSREEDEIKVEQALPNPLQALLGDSTLRLIESSESSQNPLMGLTGLLGIPLEQFKLKEDARTVTIENLTEYVRSASKPVGLINPSANPPIQFVRPERGDWDTLFLIVVLGDRIGVLVEGVEPAVQIASLTGRLAERWKEAGIVKLRRRPPIAEGPRASDIQAAVPRRRPAIIQAPPLVEKPADEQPIIEKRVPRVRPPIVKK